MLVDLESGYSIQISRHTVAYKANINIFLPELITYILLNHLYFSINIKIAKNKEVT